MAKHIGIDLGTANTLACVDSKGIVLREPSVVALNKNSGKILAVGTEAKEMIGRTPEFISVYRPLKDGVIAEFEITGTMLKMFIKRLLGVRSLFSKPDMLICIPYGITEVERMAVEDAALDAGARTVSLIDEPVAAAIGAGTDVFAPDGSMIIDIGGGTTEVAVMSLGGVVVSQSFRTAGDKMNEAIVSYVRKKYGIIIGESTAENIKITVGAVHQLAYKDEMPVSGRSIANGMPSTVYVKSSDVEDALGDIIEDLVEAIRTTLEETPPEIAGDIYENGVILSGGGSLIGGLDVMIKEITGLNTRIAQTPLDCVIKGIETVMSDMDKYSRMLHIIK